MSARDKKLWLQLAGRIADGASIDWHAEFETHPDQGEHLQRLRRAEQFAVAFRSCKSTTYDDLRELGRSLMATRPGESLHPTTLVRNAYARLVETDDVAERNGFFAAAAQGVRQLALEQARRRAWEREGGKSDNVGIGEDELPVEIPTGDLVLFDAALERLRAYDSRKADVAMLRVFGGLTNEEAGRVLASSQRDVERDWKFARALLYDEVARGSEAGPRLSADRWAEAESIFQGVVARPRAEWEEILTKKCGSDSDLCAVVGRLLRHNDGGMGRFLEAREPINSAAASSDDSTAGTAAEGTDGSFGPYRLLEVVGVGGMGKVYRAERTHPLHQIVAVKVIKRGMDTQSVIARFEAERQALALMDHPNIAKVFDAGSTPRGRPYFVMEYVKGVTIANYCDEHKLTVRERLELFIRVCEGVQHAHQKAIIHRDLKPSNVLVTIQSGKPLPKIIDFGVAKATAQKLTERTLYTALGELIGTPEYMSPEQAQMSQEDVDTRTDVYSLGVVLYELLAGGLPFEPEELRECGFEALVQMIREKDPPRPSTKVGTLGERTADVAAARGTLPRKLAGQLQGDLDWITMKALEKDRTRRYASAAGLAADVQRYLRHEPVSAGPPGAGYRVKKFVRRHRIGVAAASVVVASLVAAALVSARFAHVAATERDTARAVNDFLNNDLLAAVAPSAEKGKGKDVLMREVLDEAAKRIDEAAGEGGKFESKPLVEASIRQTLGRTYLELGEYSAAQSHVLRSGELRRRNLGDIHAETLESVATLALLYARQGHYDKAEPLMLEVLEKRRRTLGGQHPETLKASSNLAAAYTEQGRYEDAAPLMLETLQIQRRTLGELHPETLASMSNLAGTYVMQGAYDKAEPLMLETLDLEKRALGDEHPHVLMSMSNIGYMYSSQERFGEAETMLSNAIELQERILGEKHPVTLFSVSILGYAYAKQNRFEEARALMAPAVPVARRVWSESGPTFAALLGHYGVALRGLKRYEEAEGTMTEAYDKMTDALGPSSEDTVMIVEELVELYEAWGKPEKAAEWRSMLPGEESAARD